MNPADVLAHYLVGQGLARWTNVTTPANLWPMTVGVMPDEGLNALAVYGTTSVLKRRSMRTGRWVEKQGVQLRVRSRDYQSGHQKAYDLTLVFDLILDEAVTIGADDFRLHSVSRQAGVIPLGQEVGKPRFLFTVNALTTLKEI